MANPPFQDSLNDTHLGFIESIVEHNGVVRIRAEGTGWIPGTDLPPFVKGQWECWEVGVKASRTTTGYHRVWRDGNLVIDQSNLVTLPLANTYYSLMQIYTFFDGLDEGGAPQDQNLWMDKVYTTSDTPPNTYIDDNHPNGILWIGL